MTDLIVDTSVGAVNLPAYKTLVGLLSQSGTGIPSFLIFENTLGGIPVWSRDAEGVYKATLAGAFTVGKTVYPPFSTPYSSIPLWGALPFDYCYNVSSPAEVDFFLVYFYDAQTGNSVDLSAIAGVDNVLVEIRVYP